MSKLVSPLLSLAMGATGAALFAAVTLQPSSPGTKETGNINISGNVISGKVLAGLNSSTSVITGFSSATGSTAIQGTAKNFGIRGQSTATSGLTYGGYFDGSSPDGYGLWAKNKDTTNNGIGILGETEAPFGIGGSFRANLPYGTSTALNAYNNSFSSQAKGINSQVNTGYGVYSLATGPSSVAVYAKGPYGVYAEATSRMGVYGSTEAASDFGVLGLAPSSGSGHALYALGTIGASGTKSLMIDHPDDPENKYLLQFCTEGDTPQLQYRGLAKLDSSGSAFVELPSYFEKINRDPTYQLTALEAAMPNLHVAQLVKNNRFKIAGGKPGASVSWTVIGIRNDRFVKKYGAQTERQKSEEYKGTYLQPELYNQPASKGQIYSETLNAQPKAVVPPTK